VYPTTVEEVFDFAIAAEVEAERRAFVVYSELAAAADDPGLTTLLDALAAEETRHWQKLEQAYDDYIVGSLSQ